jgi:poly-gamma-glutamate synthesis protein (capsule biosynthesis protein)
MLSKEKSQLASRSSTHVRPIELFEGKLVLYGCGNFIDDYEGIRGYEEFRADLSLMYFPTVDAATGRVSDVRMVPMQIRNFRANRASPEDARWLARTLTRESRRFDLMSPGTVRNRGKGRPWVTGIPPARRLP